MKSKFKGLCTIIKRISRLDFILPRIRPDGGCKFENFLAVAAIAKNEGAYFKEWIEFHLAVGVEKFYIYDNESSDDTYEVLKPYIDQGIVEYKYLPGRKMQRVAYQDAIKKSRRTAKWLTTIDLDEFMFPMSADNIPEVIKSIVGSDDKIAQVLVGWRVFGSGGRREKPDGLVIENYLHREKNPGGRYWHKAIFNPRKAYIAECHCCAIFGKTIDEDGHEFTIPDGRAFTVPESHVFANQKLRINHYAVKSWEEWMIKKYRGDAWKARQDKDDGYFAHYDRNDVFDDGMKRFVGIIKHKFD